MSKISLQAKDLIEGNNLPPEQQSQNRERYLSLQEQIPVVYAVALANFFGLKIVAGGDLDSMTSPVIFLVVLIVWRLFHWSRIRGRTLSNAAMSIELKKTLLYAAFLSVGFSIWAQLLLTSHPAQVQAIVLFSSLAAIGCSYGLSNYRPAASLPLLLLGLPLALRLILSGHSTQIGMGISLLLTVFLVSRLLGVQNRRIVDMVSSRSRLKEEKRRAREAERQANLLAATDPLTGIANRRALLATLTDAAAADHGSPPAAVALVDLDGFKPINDAFGHPTGDAVLKCVAERLEQAFGDHAFIARIGGDEFAIFWRNEKFAAEAATRAAGICALVGQPMTIDHRVVRVQGSCGFTRADGGEWTPDLLLGQADTALYAAKRRGTGRLVAFSRTLMEKQERRAGIERRIASGEAIAKIEMVYQPITDIRSGEVVAFEALGRWSDDELGAISPDEFVCAAEQMNQIAPIAEKTLEMAVAAAAGWPEAVRLSFNFSAVQLCTAGAADRMLAIMRRGQFHPRRMMVEVTETALLSDFKIASANLAALRKAGATVALDDFGAGNASISYLKDMSFDVVKLDGSLVTSLTRARRSQDLMRGLIGLCRALGVVCIAEHVETPAQLEILRELGCDLAQGYLLGKPTRETDAAAIARPFRGRYAA